MYKQRWSEVFADPSGAAFAQIVSPDLTLEGSILARPVHGQDAVWAVLTTSSDVYDTLAFTAEAQSHGRVYLEWTATAVGLAIDGVTVLGLADDGRITTAAIHHRPLGAVLAFSQEMKKRLSDRIDPVHFL